MPYIPYGEDEITDLLDEMGLPELPEHTTDDDTEARDLILFYSNAKTNVLLIERVSLADAIEYTNRDDTHGPGWFVGRDLS